MGSPLTVWTKSFFAVEGCPVQCRMFHSILGLYPLDANNIPPPAVVAIKKCLQHCQCPLGGKFIVGCEPLTHSLYHILQSKTQGK